MGLGGGVAAIAFASLGYLHLRLVVPRLNRLLGFPSWHEHRWIRRWNYSVLLIVAAAGIASIVVSLV